MAASTQYENETASSKESASHNVAIDEVKDSARKEGSAHAVMSGNQLSIIIPTYQREDVLISTIRSLAPFPSLELILVDQTELHDEKTYNALAEQESQKLLQCVHISPPSIPHAMNVGLASAQSDVVLFLDDDIEPGENLVATHVAAHQAYPEAWAVVGQVLQPGEVPGGRNGWTPTAGFYADLDFPFWSDEPAWVSNVMAGNLSVKRERAIQIGGFDENFSGSAYRFETEFARRLINAGGKIRYEPKASLRHLRAERGGTRSAGSHLTSASPRHGMGDYYFAMRSGLNLETLAYMLKRPIREVSTRFHLTHPWYIPVKLLGELRAVMQAFAAHMKGPRLIATDHERDKLTESLMEEVC